MASAGSAERRDRWWDFVALVVLIALVAVAREVGLDFQLPTSGLADERVYIEHLTAFRSGAENTAALPGAATYPYLVSKLALATWHEPVCTSANLADHLDAAASLATQVRRVVAWLSLLSIPAMWLLVRAFSGRAVAFVAAALCGTSLFAEVFSQQGRPHGASFGLGLLALALAVQLQRRPTFPRAILAGIVAALAFAALQSGVAMLVPIGVAVLLGRDVPLMRRAGLLVAAVLPTFAALRLAYPYLFVAHIDRGVQPGHALLGEGSFNLSMLDGSGFRTLPRALWTYEPVGVVVAVLAILVAIVVAVRTWSRRDRAATNGPLIGLDPRTWSEPVRAAAVVAAYFVPYLVVFGLYERTYTRYALPLVPLLAWAGAWLLTPRGAHVRRPIAWIPAVLVVGVQALLVAKLADVRSRPDTLEEAARWIEHEGVPGARIGLFASDDLPLLRLPEQRAALPARTVDDPHRHWQTYQSRLGPGPWDANARDVLTPRGGGPEALVDAFQAGGVDYCVLRTFQYYRPKGFEIVRHELEQRAKLVATFWPVDEPDPGPFATREEYQTPEKYTPWILRLLHARTTGNLVEIWQLDRAR